VAKRSKNNGGSARTARWRERGCAIYPFEANGTLLDLAIRFAKLDPRQLNDKQAVADGLNRLLERSLEAFLREVARDKKFC
jgi:hypothetical protein